MHMSEVVVTRNGQITLSKEIRQKLDIDEGDYVIVNLAGDSILISKKDPAVWDRIESFLPADFPRVLTQIRGNTEKRLKRLGIFK